MSMYQFSVPGFIRALENVSGVLAKAAAHAEAKKIEPAALLGSRLFPDMLPLTKQVQIACDMSKNGAARLAGLEPPRHEDTETTFPELEARIRKVIDYLKTFTPEQLDGSENREIVLKLPSGPVNFKGRDYLLGFVLPNVYFHAATTYGILRHNGVELGKSDFIGSI